MNHLSESSGMLDMIKQTENLVGSNDTYRLGNIICFCASIDPNSLYRYGSPVEGLSQKIEEAITKRSFIGSIYYLENL